MTRESDKELVIKMKNGNVEAFNKLFFKYAGKVRYMARLFISDSEIAKDVVQDIFFTIWEKRLMINENLSFQSYLLQSTKNLLINMVKSRLRDAEAKKYFLDTLDRSRNQTEDYIIFRELDDEVNKQLEQLPPRQRQIFMLSRSEGLKNSEIAQKLNISKRTVEEHIHQALKQLKGGIKQSQ